MRTRTQGSAAVAVALVSWLIGCGGKDAGQGPAGTDSGAADVVAIDSFVAPSDAGAPRPDSGLPPEAGYDAGLPPGTVAPRGTQLFGSSNVRVQALTTDGYAIYSDNTTNILYAVAVAGGAPLMIGPVDAAGYVVSYGATVIMWSSTGAKLTLWTAAHGVQALSTTSTYAVAVSADNTQAALIDSIDPSTGIGNLVAIGTDGTGRRQLVSSVQAGTMSSCFPQLAFAGETLLASYCPASTPADAGFLTSTLASFAAPAWEESPFATGVYPGFVTSPSNTEVLVSNALGLELYAVAGGAPTIVDPQGTTAASFTSDSKALVYSSYDNAADAAPSGELKRAAVGATPNPVGLSSGLFEGVMSVSPDNAWALTYEGFNMTTYNTDLYLVSTTMPGAAKAIVPTQTVYYGGAFFTLDSSQVLYTTQASSGLTFALQATPSAGGAPRMLSAATYYSQPTSDAKIVFNDAFKSDQVAGAGTADLDAVDLSGPAAATVLVTQADAVFFLTQDKKQIVYSWSYAPGPLAGVWVMPAP